MSLCPLLFLHSFLIAAGDPQQLPPVIASPAALSSLTSAPSTTQTQLSQQQQQQQQLVHVGSPDSLIRPLFVRLCQLGYEK